MAYSDSFEKLRTRTYHNASSSDRINWHTEDQLVLDEIDRMSQLNDELILSACNEHTAIEKQLTDLGLVVEKAGSVRCDELSAAMVAEIKRLRGDAEIARLRLDAAHKELVLVHKEIDILRKFGDGTKAIIESLQAQHEST